MRVGSCEFLGELPVGAELWSVWLTPGPVIDDDGLRCMFRPDPDSRALYISGSIPMEKVAYVAALACAAAWRSICRPAPIVGTIAAG